MLFLLHTALWIIDVCNVVTELKITLVSTSDDTLKTKYSKAEDTILHLRLASAENLLYAYMTIIGDAIVIWHVYAFWANGRERLVPILPCAMLLASIISAIMLTYCVARLGGDIVLGSFQNPAFCKNMQTTSYSATVATTAVATFLIGYKTWRYRRSIRSSLGASVPKTRVEKIMVFLVESRMIYFLFFLYPVILGIGDLQECIEAKTNLHFASPVYQYMTSTIVGVYPTVIVVLVHCQHSFVDATANNTVTASHAIQFQPAATSYADSSTYWGSSRTGAEAWRDVVDINVQELHSMSSGPEATGEARIKLTEGKPSPFV